MPTRHRPDLNGLRVSLVFPGFKEFRDTLAFIENVDHLGVIPPVSLMYVAGILEAHGCTVQLVDANAAKLTKAEAAARIRAFRPDFLGFTLANLDFALSLDWMRSLSASLRVPIVVGGVLTKHYALDVLAHPEVTYAVVGDADETLPELLRAARDGGDLAGIPGITFRDRDGRARFTGPRRSFEPIDERPHPARHLLDHTPYFSILSQRRLYTAGMSVFGCPFPCEFCAMRKTPNQVRSAANLYEEMERCVALGIHEIDYFDPNIALGRQRVFELCERLRKRPLDIRWSVRANTVTMTPELLTAMAGAGCSWIGYGIESGDDTILTGIDKRQRGTNRIIETLQYTRKVGIRTCGFFILGLPGETHASIDRTVEFMKRAPLDWVQVSSYWSVPGTPIYDRIVANRGRDFWKDNILEGLDPRPYMLHDTALSLDDVKYRVHQAYRSFYLRPGQVVRLVSGIRTVDEVEKFARAAAGMSAGLVRKAAARVIGR